MTCRREVITQAATLYLGAGARIDRTGGLAPFELPAHHIVTHAVTFGRTGSGKTGLTLVMVEEALQAGVPVLMIDVKGDLPNVLLCDPTFAATAPARPRPRSRSGARWGRSGRESGGSRRGWRRLSILSRFACVEHGHAGARGRWLAGAPPRAPTTQRKCSAQRGHAFLRLRLVLACSAQEPAPRAYTPRSPSGTALYGLVAAQRATFARVTAEQGHVPSFVNESFERFLRCGVLAYGFARYRCASCRHDHLVPLSCKARGLCPSCGGKRMMSITRHVMDAVLPHVPTRQWVLTLPHALRYRTAYDQSLCTAVHRALAGALRKHLRRLARARGHAGAETGSVTFVQRWGSGLNLNPHYHLIGLDGWFHRGAAGELAFTRAPTPTQEEVEALLLEVHARVLRLLARRGLLEADTDDALARDAPALAACYEGAVTQRVGLGPHHGRPVLKLGTSLAQHLASANERVEGAGWLCARLDGFDLHGRAAFGAADRKRLEELVRYCARPPLAYDRLTKQADGRYLLRLKTRWRDGTTHLLFEPIELMERLAAQIPKPRVNLVLYAGVLAPHASLRARAVAHGRPEPLPPAPATETQTRAERHTWAELMRATFGLDVLECPRCGGRLKHVSTILDGRVARRILEHLGRPARAPPVAPARDPAPFWDAVEAES